MNAAELVALYARLRDECMALARRYHALGKAQLTAMQVYRARVCNKMVVYYTNHAP